MADAIDDCDAPLRFEDVCYDLGRRGGQARASESVEDGRRLVSVVLHAFERSPNR